MATNNTPAADKNRTGIPKLTPAQLRLKRRFNLRVRLAFYVDMLAFHRTEILPVDALSDMIAPAKRRRSTTPLATIYMTMKDAIVGGDDFSVAVAPWLPEAEAVMLLGGEEAGILSEVLGQLIQLLTRQKTAREKLNKVLWAAAASMAFLLGLATIIFKFVFPILESSISPDIESHMMFVPTFFAFGHFIISYSIPLTMLMVGAGVWITWSLPRWTGPWRRKLEKTRAPWGIPWALYRRVNATFFLLSNAAMLRAGFVFDELLSKQIAMSTPWLRASLLRMQLTMTDGKTEVLAMAWSGLLPEDAADRLTTYQRIPDFTSVMGYLAEDNYQFYERSLDRLALTVKSVSLIVLFLFALSLLFTMADFAWAVMSALKMARSNGG